MVKIVMNVLSVLLQIGIRQTAENVLSCYAEESFEKKFSGRDKDANYVQNLIRFSSSKMHVFGKTVTKIRSSINLFIYYYFNGPICRQ